MEPYLKEWERQSCEWSDNRWQKVLTGQGAVEGFSEVLLWQSVSAETVAILAKYRWLGMHQRCFSISKHRAGSGGDGLFDT